MRNTQKGVGRSFFGVIFFDLREKGGSNQKIVDDSIEERKKIEEVGF